MVAGFCTLLPRPAEIGDVDENQDTLVGNAKLKAVAVMRATGLPALADDTGLFVDALGGEPGVHSARFAGSVSDDKANRLLLLERLSGVAPDRRTAVFRSLMIVAWPDGHFTVAEGECAGTISEHEIGTEGFGYDAVFIPLEGDGRTYAQMSASEKNSLSHRRRAVDSLVAKLKNELQS